MRRFKQIIYTLLVLFNFSGCTLLNPSREQVTDNHDDRALIPVASQLQAIKYEDNEQFLDALDYWKQTEGTVSLKIVSLVEQLKQISKDYSQRGVAFYDQKKGHEALLVFLEALRYDPTNPVALDYLRNRYEPDRFILYPVKATDTFESISETIYGSNTYVFVLEQFSDAGKEEELQDGMIITLPQLDSYFSQPLKDFKKNLRNARKYYKSGTYEKALSFALTIRDNHPENEEASYIINSSRLKIAANQRSEHKFDDAIRTLSRIDPTFKDVSILIEETKKHQKRQRETEGKLANSELFELGRQYYAQKKYLKAMEAFLQVDPGYDEIHEALVSTRQKLQFEADFHFKEGVKFFVEEKLAEAISEWQKTLELAPGHPEAIASIDKAQKLLEKVKKITNRPKRLFR